MNLKIIMYHYVRPIKNSNYPNIKGLELKSFRKQLIYLKNNFNIIKFEDILEYKHNGKIPQNSVWLTFDDGYKDHINYVLPELKKFNLQGSFFPVKNSIVEKKLLDVNAIHFILEKINDSDLLLNIVKRECRNEGINDDIFTKYWNQINKFSRFDDEKTIFVKRMLQTELPVEIRSKIIKNIFIKYLDIDEENFSKELYMSEGDIKTLINEKMVIGNHTSNHLWLNSLNQNKQKKEIQTSLNYLKKIGAKLDNWIMCFPYGAYNKDTLKILNDLNCFIGLTTKVGDVNLHSDNLLLLNRYDTNDFI